MYSLSSSIKRFVWYLVSFSRARWVGRREDILLLLRVCGRFGVGLVVNSIFRFPGPTLVGSIVGTDSGW